MKRSLLLASTAAMIVAAGLIVFFTIIDSKESNYRFNHPAQSMTDAVLTDGRYKVNEQMASGWWISTSTNFRAPNVDGSCRYTISDNKLNPTSVVSVTGERALVYVDTNDAWFYSENCGEWRPYVVPAAPAFEFGNGMWIVGIDVVDTVYTSDYDEECLVFSGDLTKGWNFADPRFLNEIAEYTKRAVVSPRLITQVSIKLNPNTVVWSHGCRRWSALP